MDKEIWHICLMVYFSTIKKRWSWSKCFRISLKYVQLSKLGTRKASTACFPLYVETKAELIS
jgi:hypothetical protein